MKTLEDVLSPSNCLRVRGLAQEHHYTRVDITYEEWQLSYTGSKQLVTRLVTRTIKSKGARLEIDIVRAAGMADRSTLGLSVVHQLPNLGLLRKKTEDTE